MSAALFALALFGCSDDGTMCERLNTPAQTYETQALCAADIDQALDSPAARRADAPTVYARCINNRLLTSLSHGVINLTRVAGIDFETSGS